MNESQQKIYNQSAVVRNRLFQPIAFLLDKLKIKPDFLTLLSVAAMFVFIFVVENNYTLGIWLVAISIFLDMLDGVLARYQKTQSDKGKLKDVLADNLSSLLFAFGLAAAGLVNPLIIIAYVYFMVMSKILRVFLFSFRYQSDWLFKPVAGLLPNFIVYISYISFLAFVISNNNFLNWIFLIFSFFLAVDALYFLTKILNKRKSR